MIEFEIEDGGLEIVSWGEGGIESPIDQIEIRIERPCIESSTAWGGFKELERGNMFEIHNHFTIFLE